MKKEYINLKLARKNESGMALVMVVCMALVAIVLAASLFSASTSHALSVKHYVKSEQAFYIAEAGIGYAAAVIENNSYTTVPSNGLPGLTGLVSCAGGSFEISAVSSTANTFVVCSTGIYDNASRVIEVSMVVPTSTNSIIPPVVDAALAFYGTNHSLDLSGAPGRISGDDYDVPANFSCSGAACWGILTANPSASNSVYTDNTLAVVGENLIVPPPPTRIQTGGGTLSEATWTNAVALMIPLADVTITGAVSHAAHDAIGTRVNPIVTVVKTNGVLTISGTADGAGVLILEEGGQLVTSGTFHYEGLVIAFGNAAQQITGSGTPIILGAVVCLGDSADVEMDGHCYIRYSSSALANLANIASLAQTEKISLVSWREIKQGS